HQTLIEGKRSQITQGQLTLMNQICPAADTEEERHPNRQLDHRVKLGIYFDHSEVLFTGMVNDFLKRSLLPLLQTKGADHPDAVQRLLSHVCQGRKSRLRFAEPVMQLAAKT